MALLNSQPSGSRCPLVASACSIRMSFISPTTSATAALLWSSLILRCRICWLDSWGQMPNEVVSYEVEMRGYVLHASYFGPRDRSALLASADIFPLRVDLAERGIGTLALDHRGHGQTGGRLADSSLGQRVEEARVVIETVRPQKLLGAVSMSMGGYVAVKLTRVIEMPALVMIAPAMYDGDALDVPFGPAFSEIIRRSESWRRSDAWKILRVYAGRVLIVAGEQDDRIPPGVIAGCMDAVSPGKAELISLSGIDHFVMTRLRTSKDPRLTEVLDRISATLQSDE
ncbi:MAG: hypothetical protein B7Y61_07565 [Rhizobiales bacterium 35-66-30]|nr:MAG: hypothetical protein B7Y61_07565 [Rhizobiales bacterium 35-66-30]